MTEDARRALRLSAEGLDTHQAAQALGLPVERTRQLLAEAIEDLGARSKLEAVVRAHQRGLFTT